MLRVKASRELNAKFIEQLCGADVRASIEAAANQRPDHRERVIHALAGRGMSFDLSETGLGDLAAGPRDDVAVACGVSLLGVRGRSG